MIPKANTKLTSKALKTIQECAAKAMAATNRQLEHIRAPYEARISRLRKAEEKAAARHTKRAKKQAEQLYDLDTMIRRAERRERVLAAQRLPAANDMPAQRAALEAVAEILDPARGWNCYRYNLTLRPPIVDGFTIISGRQGDWAGAKRAYCAYDKKGRLVGVMQVEPSAHPGDFTHANSRVYGREIFDHSGFVQCVKPLEQFITALKKGKQS